LTRAEAAARAGLSVARLAVLASRGEGPPHVMRVGTAYLYAARDVDAWARQRRGAGRPKRPAGFGPGQLTLREAAARWGVPLGRARRLVYSRRIEPAGKIGGMLWFRCCEDDGGLAQG
jgi:hypothetical protein